MQFVKTLINLINHLPLKLCICQGAVLLIVRKSYSPMPAG
jgi:hypothetical protein